MKWTLGPMLVGCLLHLQAAGAGYDFEASTENSLVNHTGNWVDQPGQGDGVIRRGEGYNSTLVMQHHRTVIFDQSAYLTRVNNEDYGFVLIRPGQRHLILQFDVNGEALAQFGLGCDVDGDGMARTYEGEIGPVFGTFDRTFQIQEANQGRATSAAFTSVGGGNNGSDWYRLQFFVDFSAHDGQGGGSVRYANLSDGDTVPTPIPELQNIHLGLDRMTRAAPPSAWNALWLHVRSSGSNVPCADNLMVIHPPVLAITPASNGRHVIQWANPSAPLGYRLMSSESSSDKYAPIVTDIYSPSPVLCHTGITARSGFYRLEIQ